MEWFTILDACAELGTTMGMMLSRRRRVIRIIGPFDYAGLPKGDLDGIPFAGLPSGG